MFAKANGLHFVNGNRVLRSILLTGLVLLFTGCLTDGFEEEIGSDDQPSLDTLSSELLFPRSGHNAIKLSDGRVLVFGGLNEAGVDPANTEIYNPNTNSWSEASDLAVPNRRNGRALLLNDGRVLIVGGYYINGLGQSIGVTDVEVYDPSDYQFHIIASLSHSRNGASLTLLESGEVIIIGGAQFNYSTSTNEYFDDAEIFNPTTDTLRSTFNNLSIARSGHTATLMASGNVLIAGGVGSDGDATSVVEIFNKSSEGFVTTNSLSEGRLGHYGFLLSDDTVLLAGGAIYNAGSLVPISSVESYESYGAFENQTDLGEANYDGASAILSSGNPIIVGGDDVTNGSGDASVYIYDLTAHSFTYWGEISHARKKHQLTVLDDGSLLVTGGWISSGASKSVERIEVD